MSLKILGSKKRKFLRFMKGKVRRRLPVEGPRLLTPPRHSFRTAGSTFSLRKATVNRSLGAARGRNLNCGATRKCSRPVDGRRPQTFDPPGRLLGSAAPDLLASPRVSVTEPVTC